MSLLNKFSHVEIKADTRISEADKAVCLREQEAFDKSGPALEQLADLYDALDAEQRGILGEDTKDFYNPYMRTDGFRFASDDARRAMEARNEKFIDRVVSYFTRTYSVELNAYEIKKHLIPEKPSDDFIDTRRYRGWDNMTEEERADFNKKCAEHKELVAQHTNLLRHLPLRYEQIVDEIITQLGGFSFQERAMNEMLARCWSVGHRKDWRTDKTVEEFEVKNDTLKLLDSGYWCRCHDDSWRSYPEWSASDALKHVLEAVAHFQCGRMNEGHLWFPELFRYDTKNNVFPINNMEKVKNIKLFKNGRVDIKFSSAAYAQEFVENYLRRYVEVNAA